MRRRGTAIGWLSLVFCIAVLPVPAHAYIDPGSGSILLQLLIGGLVGSVFFLRDGARKAVRWIASKFGRSFPESETPRPPPASDESDTRGE